MRRDDVLDPAHETRDQIELAFADHGKSGVENRAFGFVETEEDFALGEDGGLRRVDIFRGFFVTGQNPATEANHPALFVANRKHEPPAKTVVVMPEIRRRRLEVRFCVLDFRLLTSDFRLLNDESGFFDQRQFMTLAFGPVDGVVPGIRRGAEAEEFHGFRRHPALSEIISSHLAGGFVEQTILPALGDLLVDFEQPVLEVARLLFAGVLVEFEGNFGAFGEPADGVHEADVFVFLDEGEHVAALVAAEAVENLPVRIDVEARRLFLVKRAKRNEICAGTL